MNELYSKRVCPQIVDAGSTDSAPSARLDMFAHKLSMLDNVDQIASMEQTSSTLFLGDGLLERSILGTYGELSIVGPQ